MASNLEDPNASIYADVESYRDFKDAAIAATYFILNNGAVLKRTDKKFIALREVVEKEAKGEKLKQADKTKLAQITAPPAVLATMRTYQSINDHNHPGEIVGIAIDTSKTGDFLRLDFEPGATGRGIHFNAKAVNSDGTFPRSRLKFDAFIDKEGTDLQTKYDNYVANLNTPAKTADIIWKSWSRGKEI